jgi:predicted nuclease of predicted toxin-antitoxin system
MRFLVDESTGAAVAELLRDEGHEVLAVAHAMPQAEDAEILDKACADRYIVVTNDKDFGELVYRSGHPHAGIVLLRLRDESAANRVAVRKSVLEHHAADLDGNFVVATDTQVRVRKPDSTEP